MLPEYQILSIQDVERDLVTVFNVETYGSYTWFIFVLIILRSIKPYKINRRGNLNKLTLQLAITRYFFIQKKVMVSFPITFLLLFTYLFIFFIVLFGVYYMTLCHRNIPILILSTCLKHAFPAVQTYAHTLELTYKVFFKTRLFTVNKVKLLFFIVCSQSYLNYRFPYGTLF